MGIRSKTLLATLLSGLLVAACGGGSDDSGGSGGDTVAATASSPATLDAPEDGARQVAAFIALGEASFDQAPGGGGIAKAVTTEDCGAGGTVTYDDETGRYVYDQCRETSVNFSAFIDGVLVNACTEGGAADESTDGCGADTSGVGDVTVTFGESGQALITEFNTQDDDVSLEALGSLRQRTTDNTEEFQATLQLSLDTSDTPEVALLMEELTVFEDISSGNREVSIDGGVGTDAGNNPGFNCALGFVTYETISPITFDDNDQPFAGELNVSSENGGSANIVFNSDGSVTVTVNGVSETFTAEDLASFCSTGQ